jgi:hypothetical protein
MRASGLVVVACLALAALGQPASAALRADVDAGGLVLADTVGTRDDVKLSDRGGGPFVQVAKGTLAGTACPAAGASFPGFQCHPTPLLRLDAGAGDDAIDAARLSTPLAATLGPGSDLLAAGSASDTIASLADGVRDVVDCGPGADVVEGIADPNDDIAPDCESAQRSFASSMLPKSLTVAAPSTLSLGIGAANVPLSFVATLTTAPPKHGTHGKARSLARATLAARTGRVQIRFKLPSLSKGFLSRRPSIRVQVDVIAVGADGHRYPLQLHAQAPGPRPKLVALYDNQIRLTIPARLRHPHGAG